MGQVTFRFLHISPLAEEHGCQRGSAVNISVWAWHTHHPARLPNPLEGAMTGFI